MPLDKPLKAILASMTFKYILKQFALEYDHYNQLNLVHRPRKHRVTRFHLRFSSIKCPSIFNSMNQLSSIVCFRTFQITEHIGVIVNYMFLTRPLRTLLTQLT